MFDRYSPQARRVVVRAYEQARALRHDHIDTAHLLLGLIGDPDGAGSLALERLGINLQTLRQKVEELVGAAPSTSDDESVRIPLTRHAEKALALTLREADQLGHRTVGSEHLLLGLVRQRNGAAARQLRAMGADLPHVRRQVLLGGAPAGPAAG